MSRVLRAVTGRTRVVALTWVHSGTGVRLPLRTIAQALPERVLVCVDGVHGFGARAETVGTWAATRSSPAATSGSTGRAGRACSGRTSACGADAADDPSFDGSSYGAWVAGGEPTGVPDGPTLTPGGFKPYEHRWALPEAFAFHQGIGRERVEARIRGLASRLKAQLAEIEAFGCGRRSRRGCPPASSASRSRAAIRPRSSPVLGRGGSSRASRRMRRATCAWGRAS